MLCQQEWQQDPDGSGKLGLVDGQVTVASSQLW